MKSIVRALLCSALLASVASAVPAFADTLDTFTVVDKSNGVNTYVFSLDASPTQNLSSTSTYFDITGVSISKNGAADGTGTVYFNLLPDGGGVGINFAGFFNDIGPQLFTYTGTIGTGNFAPTFVAPGSYVIKDQTYPNDVDLNGSVTISSTPEPSSLALLGTGVLGLAGLVRRKLIPTQL